MMHNSIRIAAAGTYSVLVDYDMSVEELKERGGYDRISSSINRETFRSERRGKSEIKITLFHFHESMPSMENILEEIDKVDCRPAEIIELVALGKKK